MNEREQIAVERAEIHQQHAETVQELRLMDVFRNAQHDGKILPDNIANRRALLELQNPGDQISGAWFNKLIEQTPSLAERFIWIDPPASKTDPKVLAKDREILAHAARTNGNFGVSEANLSLCRDVLGPGFSEFALIQGFRTGTLRLTPPTDAERQEWEAEQIDAHNLRLMNTPAHQLKAEVRDGYSERRAQHAQAEAERILKEKQQAEAGAGFPPLPEFHQGKRIDRNFFIKADRPTLKYFLSRFGDYQCTQRIRQGR